MLSVLQILFFRLIQGQCPLGVTDCKFVDDFAINDKHLFFNAVAQPWTLDESEKQVLSGTVRHKFRHESTDAKGTLLELQVPDGKSFWDGFLEDTVVRICTDQSVCRMVTYTPGKILVDDDPKEFADFPDWESGQVVDRAGIETAGEQFIDEVDFYDEFESDAEENIGTSIQLKNGYETRDLNIIWVPGAESLQEMEALMRLVAQKMNDIFEFHSIPLRLRANQVYTRPDNDASWRPKNEEELLPKCRQWANAFGRVAEFVPYEFSGALWHCQFPQEYLDDVHSTFRGLATLPDDISIAQAGIKYIRTVMHEIGHNLGCENQDFCFQNEPFGMRTVMGGGNACGSRNAIEIKVAEQFCDANEDGQCVYAFASAFTDPTKLMKNENGQVARLGSRIWNCAGMIKQALPFPRCPDADPFKRGICLIAQDQACRNGRVILDNTPYISDCASALRLNPYICPSGRFSFSFYNAAFGCRCCDGKRMPDRDFDIYQINFNQDTIITCFAIELQETIGAHKEITTESCIDSVGFPEGQKCQVKCLYGNGEETWECQRTSNNGEVLKRVSDAIQCAKPKMFGEICESNSQCHEDLTCVEGNCWAYCESNKKLNDFTSRQTMEDAGWSFTRILVDRYGSNFRGSSKSPSPGMLSTRLEGNGTVVIGFGNAATGRGGKVLVMLNGEVLSSAVKQHATVTTHFFDGDMLSIVESGEAMIELTSIFFTCDPLPTCRVSTNFCPGGIKVSLNPLGGCTFPECPPPEKNTCIGCVFLGGSWSEHKCNLGCIQGIESDGGIREAACYDTIEDCDYYKLQLDEVASCKQQNDCVSCTSQKHCGFERGRCTFIGEDWWLKKSMIQTPGECQDCVDCVQKGNSFNFEGKCSEKCDGDVNCYETQHDCEQWSAMKEANCNVQSSCQSCLASSPYCVFDEHKDTCILADFAAVDAKRYVDDIDKCVNNGFVDMFSDSDFMAFPGRFSQVILNKEQFLKECSDHTSPHMTCEAVMPGLWTQSIVIFFEGSTANLVNGVKNIRTQGLDLPSFPNFADPSLWPSNTQPTSTIEDILLNDVLRVSIETCHPNDEDIKSSFLLLPVTSSKSTCASHALNHPECGSFFLVRGEDIPCGCVRKDVICNLDWKPFEGSEKCDHRYGCDAMMYRIAAPMLQSILMTSHSLINPSYGFLFIIAVLTPLAFAYCILKQRVKKELSNQLLLDELT